MKAPEFVLPPPCGVISEMTSFLITMQQAFTTLVHFVH